MGRLEYQSGFGIVYWIVAIAAIGAIGSAGVLLYRHYHSHYSPAAIVSTSKKSTPLTTNTSTASNTSANSSTTSSPKSYFTISEWGIRAPYNGSISLQYVVDKYDQNSVDLSSSELAVGGPAVCIDTLNGEAGHLARYLPTDANLGPKIPASETAEQYVESNPTIPHAKIGSYIYIYWGYMVNGSYSGPCDDKSAAIQTMTAYAELVPKLEAIQ
ncbi:MAG TPA: hypothetical protein VFT53_06805 [Candidatus Saccharimonadales bacterium]|nr:hypothetical protein [Candidatus Saccharimonadales bacterium]